MVENVCVPRQTARAAHGGDTFPLAETHVVGGGNLVRVQLDEIAYEKIEVAVPVIIEESAASAPTDVLLGKARLMGNIGKGAIAVVMKENVMAPEATKQVVPSIIVEIAHADAGLPTGTPEPRLFSNIGKGAVTVVLVQVRDRFLSSRPMRIEAISIAEVDVEPAVMVVVEKGQSASLGFNDDPLAVYTAPHVGDVQPGLLSHIEKLNRKRSGLRCSGLHDERILPFRKWSRQSVGECAAEHDER